MEIHSYGTVLHAIQDLKAMEKIKPEVIVGLEEVLSQCFAETDALVHVITGSLKLSGKMTSELKSDVVWEGVLTYGGPSTGVNNPVQYAIYEMARGGAHDWFRTLPAFDPMFEEVMNRQFD